MGRKSYGTGCPATTGCKAHLSLGTSSFPLNAQKNIANTRERGVNIVCFTANSSYEFSESIIAGLDVPRHSFQLQTLPPWTLAHGRLGSRPSLIPAIKENSIRWTTGIRHFRHHQAGSAWKRRLCDRAILVSINAPLVSSTGTCGSFRITGSHRYCPACHRCEGSEVEYRAPRRPVGSHWIAATTCILAQLKKKKKKIGSTTDNTSLSDSGAKDNMVSFQCEVMLHFPLNSDMLNPYPRNILPFPIWPECMRRILELSCRKPSVASRP